MQNNLIEPVYNKLFPFWNQISPAEREYLLRHSSAVNYNKDAKIHNRLYMMSDSGRDITLYRLYEGDICMLTASCVLQAITFDVFANAEEDSQCFVISGPAFAKLSESNPYIKIFALETAVNRFSDVMWVMQQILFMSMDKRLAIFLTDEIARTGQDSISLTHEQIARYIGSAREVISRMLKYFSSEGIVELSRKGIKILDKNRLRALAY